MYKDCEEVIQEIQLSLQIVWEHWEIFLELIWKSVLAFNTFCKYLPAHGFLVDNLLRVFEVQVMPLSLITSMDLSLSSAWGMTQSQL